MKSSTLLTSALTIVLTANSAHAAIYSEDFNDQAGKGATGGSPTTINTAEVDWTIDVSGGLPDGSGGFFRVNENTPGQGEFVGKDVDGTVFWYSPEIDISSSGDVNVSIRINSISTFENSDALTVGYLVDGVLTNFYDYDAPTGSSNANEPPQGIFTSSQFSGNNLKIVVSMNNNSGAEAFRIDDIVVDAVPEPGSLGLLSLGGLCLLCRRKS